MAQYAVRRDGLPGEWPAGYGDASAPGTPAWQEAVTSVPAAAAARVAREFARNAELSRGRSMIAMGAGTNHWFHSDQIYRTFFTLIMLCGCEGVNGGGWAHYVGQEKVRPLTGWATLAFALDWQRPTRHMTGTSFFYLHSDQWRYESFGAAELASPLGRGLFAGRTFADCLAQASRAGWTPSHPAFDRNPLDLADEAARAGKAVPDYVVQELRAGRLRFAGEDPDDPRNFPRVLTVWRANLLGSSGKGMEYFMRHLVGADDAVRAAESPPRPAPGGGDLAGGGAARQARPADRDRFPDDQHVHLRGRGAAGRRPGMRSTTSPPPTCTRSCTRSTRRSRRRGRPAPTSTRSVSSPEEFSRLAATHLGTRTDVIAAPLMHDTPDELAQPGGRAADWKAGECEPVPGVTMPRLVTVERDYAAVAEKMAALGPLIDTLGTTTKGVTWVPAGAVDYLRRANGIVRGGVGDGRPSLARDVHLAEAILALSGTTNGQVAVQAWQQLEQRTGVQPGRPGRGALGGADLVRRHAGPAAGGDHLPGVVRQRDRRPAVRAVHGQRRAQETLAHAHRADAFLPRPRLDARIRRGAAGLPAAAGLRPALRRPGPGRGRPAGDHRPLPHPALEVVDPLRVRRQPAHAAAVPRRPGDLDEPGRRCRDRREPTTTGSRPTTATGWSPAGPWSATGCRRARCSCTTPRTGT